MQYIVLDFETADYSSDSACALALVRVAHGRIEDEFYSLIKPLGGNFAFSWLHCITREAVRDAPGFGELWPLVVNFIGNASYLVAHNAPFDRRVLRACCQRAPASAGSAFFMHLERHAPLLLKAAFQQPGQCVPPAWYFPQPPPGPIRRPGRGQYFAVFAKPGHGRLATAP